MEKLPTGGGDVDKGRRSSRVGLKVRIKLKKNSPGANNDQEQRSVEKVSEEHSKNDPEQQSRVGKVSEVNSRFDPQRDEIIENAENQDVQKKGSLDGDLSGNFRFEDAEEKGKKKRGFTLALTREQIEEDIVELLGPRASRKRAKKKGYGASVHHPLSRLFPAAWMETLIDY